VREVEAGEECHRIRSGIEPCGHLGSQPERLRYLSSRQTQHERLRKEATAPTKSSIGRDRDVVVLSGEMLRNCLIRLYPTTI
jgi:hypothetical protein